jgi:superfamily II DNA or RNA helicase
MLVASLSEWSSHALQLASASRARCANRSPIRSPEHLVYVACLGEVLVVLTDAPEVGQLVRVRGQQWVVANRRDSHLAEDPLAASRPPGRTLLELSSVSDDDLGERLDVIWEVEPGRQVLPPTTLPAVTVDGFDDPQILGAFLDAVRWGTVASADTDTLQSPFRSGIAIKDYQLEPVAKALRMPRVNLLVADDVGLGKTIEAGLVIQEMLLRFRARRVVVVCPAPLTIKWREEMDSKFGLDFTVLDTAQLKQLRRTHGLQANPFTVYPKLIISLQWLRTPRVQRLLDEVLTPDTRHPGFIDLLVVDEAHHCAPPAPARRRGYAVDSKQTEAVRRLGEYSQHRVFLSATPHNGYPESWQALLEMLDPQRFTRGVEPNAEVLQQVLVRRLKDEIVDADGAPQFAPRHEPRAIEVQYTADEVAGHALLEAYTATRATGARATDLVTLLLKKRLFSSPAAFARTLAQHALTVRKASRGQVNDDDLDDLYEWDDEDDSAVASVDEESFLIATASALDAASSKALADLMIWADRHGQPADSKARALVQEITGICKPDGEWKDDRVIVFTEYRATQLWLQSLLEAQGLGGDGRLQLLYGGMDENKREYIKAAFQAGPERDPVRILLATDTASEGIDLQNHCHRVINYDIPFNPNRLEQRIGRVDRFGQHHPVEVAHFVGSGWREATAGSFDGDLEFLARVATKVAQERADLGRINPVLAQQVEAQMLGRPVLRDATRDKPTGATMPRAELDLRDQVRRLRAQLDASVSSLHVAPANVRRAVDTALALAGQPALHHRTDQTIDPPDLRAGWERTVDGLVDPLDPTIRRSMTFDAQLAESRDDLVLAHLEHPLVAQSTRLLRSAVWGGHIPINRVSAVTASLPPDADLDRLLIAVFSRLVVVGVDGSRLHEEVMLAARSIGTSGGGRRIELDQPRNSALREAVEAALDPAACRPAPLPDQARLAELWGELGPALAGDIAHRAGQRVHSLDRQLEARRSDEVRRIEGVFAHLRRTLADALAIPQGQQLDLLDDLQLPELDQLNRDRAAWQARLDGLDDDLEREIAAAHRRYLNPQQLVFPFAVLLVSPGNENSPTSERG